VIQSGFDEKAKQVPYNHVYNTNGTHVNLETENWNENRKNSKRTIILPSTKT
jgi:hypothetical protein